VGNLIVHFLLLRIRRRNLIGIFLIMFGRHVVVNAVSWGSIFLAGPDNVVNRRNDDDASIHDNTPVHVHRVWLGRGWEERKYIDRCQVKQGDNINHQTPLSKGIPRRGKPTPAKTAVNHAAKSDGIRSDQSTVGNGKYGVQGRRAADVDESNKDSEDKGDNERVDGDIVGKTPL
jgi:hypothetical protein